MGLGHLRFQPGQTGVQTEPVGDESKQFHLCAVDLGPGQVADAALEQLGVRRLVLQVLVVVIKCGSVQSYTVVRKVRLDAQFPGFNRFILEGRQHNDGGDDILATVGQVAAARLEAAGVGGVQQGVVVPLGRTPVRRGR